MDPEPERSVDVVDDDMSQPSYKPEQLLSEASDVSLPSHARMHYRQFVYSTTGTEDELSGVMLPILPNPIDADHLEPTAPIPSLDQSVSLTRQLPQLFSDHERALFRQPN